MKSQIGMYKAMQVRSETPASSLIAALECLERSIVGMRADVVTEEQIKLRERSIEILQLLLASLDFKVNLVVADGLASIYLFINSKMRDYQTTQEELDSCGSIVGTIKSAFQKVA